MDGRIEQDGMHGGTVRVVLRPLSVAVSPFEDEEDCPLLSCCPACVQEVVMQREWFTRAPRPTLEAPVGAGWAVPIPARLDGVRFALRSARFGPLRDDGWHARWG